MQNRNRACFLLQNCEYIKMLQSKKKEEVFAVRGFYRELDSTPGNPWNIAVYVIMSICQR